MGLKARQTMTWIEVFETIEEMRNAQKYYFQTRDQHWLELSKWLEPQVDDLVQKSLDYLRSQLPKK